MNIDYNNLREYFDEVHFKDGAYICDKNRDIQADPKTYQILKLSTENPYCDFWAKTENRSKVMKYFKNKYIII